MGKLTALIGLPRSGKSTFSKIWRNEGENRVVLSGDLFRLSIHGQRFLLQGEELVKGTMFTAARALLMDGYEVLLDETNSSINSIRSILSLSPNPRLILFNTSAKICKQRATECGQQDLLSSIERMDKNLEYTLDFLDTIGIKYETV